MKGCDKMQKDISVKEIRSETIEEFLEKLEKSEQDYKEGRIHDAEEVFKELREKYGY